jgi:hypothetical protein
MHQSTSFTYLILMHQYHRHYIKILIYILPPYYIESLSLMILLLFCCFLLKACMRFYLPCSIGREITKVVPPSELLYAEIFPLWAFTIALLMYNPRPVPCYALPLTSLVANFSNNRGMISSGMPPAVSLILIST